jgi:hypothetical protein
VYRGSERVEQGKESREGGERGIVREELVNGKDGKNLHCWITGPGVLIRAGPDLRLLWFFLFGALSAALAAKFNISPGRWQHFWPVAIVPIER